MKENWFAILMFSIVFGVLGFLLGSNCCQSSDCDSKSCTSESASCDKSKCDKSSCEYSKQECAHKSKSCSSDKHHKVSVGGEDNIEVIISDLGEDFVGDTIISIDGGEVSISKSDDGELRVEVEMEEVEGGDEEIIIKKEIKVISED